MGAAGAKGKARPPRVIVVELVGGGGAAVVVTDGIPSPKKLRMRSPLLWSPSTCLRFLVFFPLTVIDDPPPLPPPGPGLRPRCLSTASPPTNRIHNYIRCLLEESQMSLTLLAALLLPSFSIVLLQPGGQAELALIILPNHSCYCHEGTSYVLRATYLSAVAGHAAVSQDSAGLAAAGVGPGLKSEWETLGMKGLSGISSPYLIVLDLSRGCGGVPRTLGVLEAHFYGRVARRSALLLLPALDDGDPKEQRQDGGVRLHILC